MIVFPASLRHFSQSKLNLVSQINMFGWDLTRLTTSAAEMDRMWGGKEKPLCGKMLDACTYTPAVKAFIHTGSPISGQKRI